MRVEYPESYLFNWTLRASVYTQMRRSAFSTIWERLLGNTSASCTHRGVYIWVIYTTVPVFTTELKDVFLVRWTHWPMFIYRSVGEPTSWPPRLRRGLWIRYISSSTGRTTRVRGIPRCWQKEESADGAHQETSMVIHDASHFRKHNVRSRLEKLQEFLLIVGILQIQHLQHLSKSHAFNDWWISIEANDKHADN